jgi:beta-lactamase regulating signal transducer with metallopeptidase domain
MSWIFLALIVVMGFALLKIRRRRKTRSAGSSYYDSKAA